MRSLPRLALCALGFAVVSLHGDDAPLHYLPARHVSGPLRCWGHVFVRPLLAAWEADFHRLQPQVSFEDDLASSAAALAGLYSGRANVGILAREITPAEKAAYEKMTRQKIFPVTVLTGSYSDPDTVMAPGVFVAANNPLRRLTFAQLRSVFGAEGGHPAQTWGELGLTGEWADRPIHPYSGPVTDAMELYFAHTVLQGADLWNDRLQERGDLPGPGGKAIDGYRRVVEALAGDPDGIALTAAGDGNSSVKELAIAEGDAGPFVAATRENVAARTYPLSRAVRFYLNCGKSIPADPVAVEFLRYVLSADGQAIAAHVCDFLPLPPQEARKQLRLLDAAETPPNWAPAGAGLRLVAAIPVPDMSGTWDHLTSDGATGRLFLSAQDDHAVDVVDVRARCWQQRLSGGFNRPQGECYAPGVNQLVVTNGRDGTCRIFHGDTLEPSRILQLSMGADMIVYDAAAKRLYVESGGRDSNRGPGKLTVVDATSDQVTGEIVTDYRAAAMAIEQNGPRLFVALPGANQVAVVDRPAGRIVARFSLPGRPASLALDEANRRLFVATRTFKDDQAPAQFVVLNADTGALIARLSSADATENMFYDAAHAQIYTSSLEGAVQVFHQDSPDTYSGPASISVAPHAGTSEFIPALNLYCVAVPPHPPAVAQVWLFQPR